jgi:hypothetical protein
MPGPPQPLMIYTRILDPDFCARAEGAYHLCVLHSTLSAPLLSPPPPILSFIKIFPHAVSFDEREKFELLKDKSLILAFNHEFCSLNYKTYKRGRFM